MSDLHWSASERGLKDTGELLVSLQKAESIAACQGILSRRLKSAGFERFCYITMNPPNFKDRSYVYTTYPQEWVSRYRDNDYIFVDPMVANARQAWQPFAWGGNSPLNARSAKQRLVVSESREWGHDQGITVPIRGRNGEFAFVVMIMMEDREGEAQAVFEDSPYSLLLTTLYFHNAISERLHRRSLEALPELTSSQVEVLRLASLGKTVWEISVILQRSENTIKYHIKQAGQRLGTFGITATVAKAMSLGYITP